ncbi:MAG: ABC transporter ATP-binding protein, partial [Lentisphaeria bacterium]|nr:ABC transporter ATP-binding protein [Lentisphaeria bacterium]
LLLDEPLANLDAKLRRDMRSEIRRVCKESGLTALYVTHDRQEALSMADRMAVLKDGQVLQVGTPGEVYRHPLNSFVANFIGETNVISGTIREVDDKRLVADTPLGTIVSCNPHPPVAAGDTVLLSLRPETIRRKRQDEVRNTFQATCLQTTYLGELAEHVLGVRDEIHLKMFEINPRTRPEQGTCIDLAVDPEDVVVLNDGLNV